jgi:Pyruvate/2-oxoacid:ferredoxin oxidoreductase delta subunit
MRVKNAPPPKPVFRYHTPPLSGNVINGVGETVVRRPTRVFHWPHGKPPHAWIELDLHFNHIAGVGGPMFGWAKPWLRIMNLWQLRRANGPVAKKRREVKDPAAMSREITALTRKLGGQCIVGITRVLDDSIVEGEHVGHEFAICIGAPMNRELMVHVPEAAATTEVMRGYRRVAKIAVELSERIRAMGWPAKAHGDPKTGAFEQIPHAIEAGLGQLGKHGSLISREYGSNFRLSAVTTDLPLAVDAPVDIGVDDLCISCRRCVIDCPPGAIGNDKVLVRGVEKWYVDFDRCVPYFAENSGCAICIEVCPWSEPGRGFALSERLLAKRQ